MSPFADTLDQTVRATLVQSLMIDGYVEYGVGQGSIPGVREFGDEDSETSVFVVTAEAELHDGTTGRTGEVLVQRDAETVGFNQMRFDAQLSDEAVLSLVRALASA